jgi:NADPH:quinone reductase-like Zn-dependent oxidoreductase
MPHAIQIRRTGGPAVLNWTPIEVGEPGPGQVRLHQVAAGLNYIDVYHRTRRDAREASADELFEVVASGKVRINVNQRFALKDAAHAHEALGARATSGSTILTI